MAAERDCGAGLQRKGDDTRWLDRLILELVGECGNEHFVDGVAAVGGVAAVADAFHVWIGGAGDIFLLLAIPPFVGDHAVRCGESAGGNRGVANAGFRGSVGICRVVKPSAVIDEALEAAGPVGAEFVDIVAAHLVDDQDDDEFGAGLGDGY